MKNLILSARYQAPTQIALRFLSPLPEKKPPVILLSGQSRHKLSHVSFHGNEALVNLDSPLPLGVDYRVFVPGIGVVPLNVDEVSLFPNFDETYAYSGDDLGASYSKQETRFAVWAPLSSAVYLHYRKPNGAWLSKAMTRSPKGVYRTSLEGDCAGFEYRYAIVNSGILRETTDLYAKASTQNGESSVVVDFSALQIDLKKEGLPYLGALTDAILYEGSVRDLTSSPHTDIVHKGTFLGLIEKGRKTEEGRPAGFDYLVSLGFTHLQLLPIFDFKTVDEKDPKKAYNWGYDPAQYFVPEGSYASVLDDPLSRIKDLKQMVAAYHEAGIRIVMDVVFNHVYEVETSPFEATVPNYYFRHEKDGSFSGHSGCGDDFASEKKMARKLILDACAWWIDQYGVDGFRFDLMGLLDQETLLEIKELAKKRDPSFVLYGEGWDMGAGLAFPLGTMGQASSLPEFAFFNDQYRETAKKFFSGDLSQKQGFKFAFAGSAVSFLQPAKFPSAKQTLNYVECHDGATYFDCLKKLHPHAKKEELLQRVEMANAAVALSFGVPFFHAGQEIGASKQGDENSYNKGDEINGFPYELLDERWGMVEEFKAFLKFRSSFRPLHAYDPSYIDRAIDVEEEGDSVTVAFLDPASILPRKKVIFFFHPTNQGYTHARVGEERIALSSCPVAVGDNEKELAIPPCSCLIVEED